MAKTMIEAVDGSRGTAYLYQYSKRQIEAVIWRGAFKFSEMFRSVDEARAFAEAEIN